MVPVEPVGRDCALPKAWLELLEASLAASSEPLPEAFWDAGATLPLLPSDRGSWAALSTRMLSGSENLVQKTQKVLVSTLMVWMRNTLRHRSDRKKSLPLVWLAPSLVLFKETLLVVLDAPLTWDLPIGGSRALDLGRSTFKTAVEVW